MKAIFKKLIAAELDSQLIQTPFAFRRLTSGRLGESLMYKGIYNQFHVFLDVIFDQTFDSFNADLLWTTMSTPPMISATFDPEELIGHAEGCVRLDLLWSKGTNGWELQPPPPPVVTRRSIADIFRQANNRISPQQASEQLPNLVKDFCDRLSNYGVPYLNRVLHQFRR